MSSTPVFDVEHLSKTYSGAPPVRANRDISLTVARGTIWGLFGPSGAGKTTVVRQMLGLLKPTQGRVLLYGQDISRRPQIISTEVGYLPQSGTALYDFTPEEALCFTGRLRGLSARAARAEAERLIALWQLGPLRRRLIRRLSGGQQRLVGLVSILAGRPGVLVFDEPTNFMDPGLRRQVWERLLQLNRAEQTTIVLVTHNVLEAETVVSQVAIIDGGRLVVQGAPSRLKASLGERVHLDVTWNGLGPEIERRVMELGHPCQRLDDYRWRVTVPKAEADAAVRRLLACTSLHDVGDLRLHGVSLEDYYLAVTNDHSAPREDG